MKTKKIILLLLVLFIFFQFCLAQETPKAILFDEFDGRSCDDFSARIDNFYLELNNNLTSQGYVIFYGNNDELEKKLRYEMMFDGTVKFRKYDKTPIIKIRNEETGNAKVQLWIVPAGAEKPAFSETKWDFTLRPDTKPFIVYADYYDSICSSGSYYPIYSEYLLGNPKARGNIVISKKSFRAFLKTKKEVLKQLPDVSEKRLKFFHVRGEGAGFELWIVPPKKK